MAINAIGETNRQGKEIITITGTFPVNGILVASPVPYDTIDAVNVTVNQATAPTTSTFTWNFTGGVLSVYAWKATAAGDTTLIASDAEETASITIIGRRRR